MLDKSEAPCRRPRFSASTQIHRQLLKGYFQAVQTGEMTPLMNLLSEDVILWADGGGKVKQAALRPIRGRDAVVCFSLGTRRFWPKNSCIEPGEVNGQAALIIRAGEKAFNVFTIDVEQGQIQAIGIIANPDQLARI